MPRQTGPSGTPSSASLVPVLADYLHLAWPLARGFILSSLERQGRGRWNEEYVLSELRSRNMQLWLACRGEDVVAAAVSRISVYPTGLKALHMWAVGGDFKHAGPLLPQIEEWGRQNGCTVAEAYGRKGWLRRLGWKWSGVELMKEL